jgi:hypothetical protein
MKTTVSLLVPILSLALLLSPAPARAEEPVPVKLPADSVALLSSLLKASSSASAADGQGQSQDLQAALTTLLKTLAQLNSDSMTGDLPTSTSASSRSDQSEAPGGPTTTAAPSPASGRNLSMQSIQPSSPLKTSGLVSGGLGARLDDTQWRTQFQTRSKAR